MKNRIRKSSIVLIDTHILLYDFLFRNSQYQKSPGKASQKLYFHTNQAIDYLRKDRRFETFLPSFSIARLVSLLAQYGVAKQEAIKEVQEILNRNTIASFSASLIQEAIDRFKDDAKVKDLEDCFRYMACSESLCYYILTVNKKDFNAFADISVVHPKNHRKIIIFD